VFLFFATPFFFSPRYPLLNGDHNPQVPANAFFFMFYEIFRKALRI